MSTVKSVALLLGVHNLVPPVVHDLITQTFSSANGSASPATLANVTLGDLIVVCVHCEKNSATQTVSSVTDTIGNTYTQRSQLQWTGGGSGNAAQNNLEVWYTVASGSNSSNAITVTLSAATDDAGWVAFRVSGQDALKPWDTNAALPTYNHDSVGSSNGSVSGVSTSFSYNIVLEIIGSASSASFTAGTGFTLIGQASNSGGTNFSHVMVAYKAVTAPQSGITVGTSHSSETWGIIADAVTAVSGV